MTKKSLSSPALVAALVVAIAGSGLPRLAVAAPVGTEALLGQQEGRSAQAARVQAKLARADVQRAMVALGVDPAAAQERVASLSDAEVATLERELDRLPAGGDALAVVGIVFIVLLILELVGVTNIFTRF